MFKSPKTRQSRRTITLPSLTVEALARHRAEQAAERLRLGLGKGDLVFTGPEGSMLDPNNVTKAFAEVVRAIGVRRITFHGLRHTHISHQLMDGVHVKVVSERAGHANVGITLLVYAAFIPNSRPMLRRGLIGGFDRNSVASRWQKAIISEDD